MIAARHVAEVITAPDPIEALRLRAWARATLWQVDEVTLHEAVDVLQLDAVRDGLVAQLGQDAVQAIVADAFAGMRERNDDLIPASTELDDDESASVAGSTVSAAEYLMQQRDPDRMRRWLDRHTADERRDILGCLTKKRRANAS